MIALALATGLFIHTVLSIQDRRDDLKQVARGGCVKGDQKACEGVQPEVRAAVANEDIVDIAVWQFIAGLVGLVLVAQTLKATRDAVKEANDASKVAREALSITREMSERQIRAYIQITDVYAKAVDVGGVPEIYFTVHNCGQTPARHVEVRAGAITTHDARAERIFPPRVSKPATMDIGAGHGKPQNFSTLEDPITPGQYNGFLKGEWTLIFFCYVKYTDVFGRIRRTLVRAHLHPERAAEGRNRFVASGKHMRST